PPGWLWIVLGALVAVGVLGKILGPTVELAQKIIRFVRRSFQSKHGPAARRRRFRRRFAEHLANELRQLALQEEWRDDKYAELEAEVEIERRRHWLAFGRQARHQVELEREPSLSRALQRSRDRRILIEGEPGSGKSVALRHVAWQLADRVAR